MKYQENSNVIAQAILLMVMIMSSVPLVAPELPITKPGCDAFCGNVAIPFPFGTREECSFSLDFVVDCRNSSVVNGFTRNTPYTNEFTRNSSDAIGFTPFLRNRDVAIDSISVENGQLRVFNPPIAVGCQTNSSTPSLKTKITPFDFSPFTVSSTSNFLFVTGCNTYGLFQGGQSSLSNRYLVFGCMSFCELGFNLDRTSCSDGTGCCQTTVPPQLALFNSSLNSLDAYVGGLERGSCSYSFIAETAFNDSILRRKDSINGSSKFPMILSWSIRNSQRTTVDLKNLSSYACKEGSYSLNISDDGYRCVCSKGFEGNPYIGCTDIDECARPNNGCTQDCENIPGRYICRCWEGYYVGSIGGGPGCIPIKNSNKTLRIIVEVGGIAVGCFLFLITSFLLYKTIRKRRDKNRRSRFFKKNGGQLFDQLSANGNNIEKVHKFTAQELDKATDHFNENRVLGRGGQGTVYKGMLTDGKIIAVKKSKLVDASQIEQFINEVVILSYIDHRNVVKLLGCCLETEVPLLVYEFIPNGTLYDLIHNNEGDDFPFSWEVRVRTIKEIARALSYLHSTTSIPVYHRDVKSSNILLDEKYRAKVSDFGISRHISIDQTHLTTVVKGTFGYLDPEYFQSSQFTDKSDVYSFGVVLVELLTGRKPVSLYWVEEEECHVSLTTKFLQSMEGNSLHDILDARVLETARVDELEVVAKLAQNCLRLDGRQRPTMTQVTMELEGIFQTATLPSLVESSLHAAEIGTTMSIELPSGTSVSTTSTSVGVFLLL